MFYMEGEMYYCITHLNILTSILFDPFFLNKLYRIGKVSMVLYYESLLMN